MAPVAKLNSPSGLPNGLCLGVVAVLLVGSRMVYKYLVAAWVWCVWAPVNE